MSGQILQTMTLPTWMLSVHLSLTDMWRWCLPLLSVTRVLSIGGTGRVAGNLGVLAHIIGPDNHLILLVLEALWLRADQERRDELA